MVSGGFQITYTAPVLDEGTSVALVAFLGLSHSNGSVMAPSSTDEEAVPLTFDLAVRCLG